MLRPTPGAETEVQYCQPWRYKAGAQQCRILPIPVALLDGELAAYINPYRDDLKVYRMSQGKCDAQHDDST